VSARPSPLADTTPESGSAARRRPRVVAVFTPWPGQGDKRASAIAATSQPEGGARQRAEEREQLALAA
jgi:hypothetical protein